MADPQQTDAPTPEDPIGAETRPFISNAGLVILTPFLPRLFDRLDLLVLNDNGAAQMRDRETESRAVHLLQYLATGQTEAPEHLLLLNKVLAGVLVEMPMNAGTTLTDEEISLCESLLKSTLANWPALSGGTSIAGLRETFLQREGRLQPVDDGWQLVVERKTLDVLLDQVPWTFRIIKHPWMLQAMHVTW